MNKEFDVVVHGASGFTGRLVVEYLMARCSDGYQVDKTLGE